MPNALCTCTVLKNVFTIHKTLIIIIIIIIRRCISIKYQVVIAMRTEHPEPRAQCFLWKHLQIIISNYPIFYFKVWSTVKQFLENHLKKGFLQNRNHMLAHSPLVYRAHDIIYMFSKQLVINGQHINAKIFREQNHQRRWLTICICGKELFY